MIRIERRLEQPRWLSIAVPVGSILIAFVFMTVVLLATHHPPLETFRKLFDNAFIGADALNATFVAAMPLVFTGLCAAVAFRMQLFNIGGEGQLYAGAILGAAAAIALGNHSGWVSIPAMVAADGRRGCARTRAGRAPGVPQDERDHHVADAQLRCRALSQLPHLRFALVLARHVERDGEGVSAGQESAAGGKLADDERGPARAAARAPDRRRRRGPRLGALHAHALRVRGAGDRRLAARRQLRRHAHAPEDPCRHGALRCDCRHRGCKSGRRLSPHARPARSHRRGLRLRGDRDRGARPLQPVCRLHRRLSARRPAERRVCAAGSRLPIGPGRRHAGLILFCALGGEVLVRNRIRIDLHRSAEAAA